METKNKLDAKVLVVKAASALSYIVLASPVLLGAANLLGWADFSIWEIFSFYIALGVYHALKNAIAEGYLQGQVKFAYWQGMQMLSVAAAHAAAEAEANKPKEPRDPNEVVVTLDPTKKK